MKNRNRNKRISQIPSKNQIRIFLRTNKACRIRLFLYLLMVEKVLSHLLAKNAASDLKG